MSPVPHGSSDPENVGCAVITASDTRDLESDESGALLRSLLEGAGHVVHLHRVVTDDPAAIRAAVAEAEADPRIRAILLCGGTGIAARDGTFETVISLIERPLPGFGELFRMLSYREVGSAAMLTRATAGIRGRRVIFSLPGSPSGAGLALRELILPELRHVVGQLDLH